MAGIACVGVTARNLWGIRESAWFNDVLVVFKIGVLVLFVMAGLFLIDVDNFSPFSPNGPMGVMEGAALIFFAFSGFGRVAMISEEVKDPQRTVPKAIILSLGRIDPDLSPRGRDRHRTHRHGESGSLGLTAHGGGDGGGAMDGGGW